MSVTAAAIKGLKGQLGQSQSQEGRIGSMSLGHCQDEAVTQTGARGQAIGRLSRC